MRSKMSMPFVLVMILVGAISLGGCATGYYRVTEIEAASVSTAGEYANGPSEAVAISPDGRFAAFVSEATNLVPGVVVPQNIGQYKNKQVYLRDLETRQTEIVSLDSNGQPVNGRAFQPSISSFGRFVAFMTDAQEVVPGLYAPAKQRVYVRDRVLGRTQLVSKKSNGYRFTQHASHPAVLPDGSGIAFLSAVPGGSAGDGVFKHDLASAKTFELQVQPGTSNPVKGFIEMQATSLNARVDGTEISADNDTIAFVSYKKLPWLGRDGLTIDQGGGQFDHPFVYVLWRGRDLLPASLPPTLNHSGNNSHPAVGGNGGTSLIAFESDNPSWGSDSNGATDIFVFRPYTYLRPNASPPYFERVSVTAEGEEADGPSRRPSAAANLVAFESDATNLVPGDTNGTTDIFLSGSIALGDATIGPLRLVSQNRCGRSSANGTSTAPAVSLSRGEASVAFLSTATDLVWNSPSTPKRHVYVWRERWTRSAQYANPRLDRYFRCLFFQVYKVKESPKP